MGSTSSNFQALPIQCLPGNGAERDLEALISLPMDTHGHGWEMAPTALKGGTEIRTRLCKIYESKASAGNFTDASSTSYVKC